MYQVSKTYILKVDNCTRCPYCTKDMVGVIRFRDYCKILKDSGNDDTLTFIPKEGIRSNCPLLDWDVFTKISFHEIGEIKNGI
jgi:hypothetical protein